MVPVRMASTVSIAVKEMIPVIIATALWGSHWSQYRVNTLSDNISVVSAITSRTSRDLPHMAHLLRCLFSFEAHYDCELTSDHIPGKLNKAADTHKINFHLFSLVFSRSNNHQFLLHKPYHHSSWTHP